jgi:hypothetical protein
MISGNPILGITSTAMGFLVCVTRAENEIRSGQNHKQGDDISSPEWGTAEHHVPAPQDDDQPEELGQSELHDVIAD